MKTLNISVLLSIAAFTFSAHADSLKLVGTWRSNKQATITYLKQHTKLTPEVLAKLEPVLGKMVLTFDSRTLTMRSGEWKFASPYRVIKEEKDALVIEAEDPGTKKVTQTKLEFEGNSFWTPEEKIPGYKERFDRVPQEKVGK